MPEPRRSRMNAHSSRQNVSSESQLSSTPPETRTAAENKSVPGLAPRDPGGQARSAATPQRARIPVLVPASTA